MQMQLSFAPSIGSRGTTTIITGAFDSTVGRIEVYAYSQPNITPTSEQGWFKLGVIGWSGGAIPWNVDEWTPGRYTVAVIAYDRMGVMAGHWFVNDPTRVGVQKLPLYFYDISPYPPGTRVSPDPGSTGPLGVSPIMIALGAAAVVGFLWWRGRQQ